MAEPEPRTRWGKRLILGFESLRRDFDHVAAVGNRVEAKVEALGREFAQLNARLDALVGVGKFAAGTLVAILLAVIGLAVGGIF